MDIHLAYSCFLGHPWNYGAGAVTSTLHQKLKYPVKGKIVTVCGEEEFMVRHLNSFKYVEMDGEFIETPCQAFEIVPPMVVTTKIFSNISKDDEVIPRMVSLKDAYVVVEDGSCTIWVQLPDIPFKVDKFGSGFTIKAQKEVRRAHMGKPPLHIGNHEVKTMEDSNDECAFEEQIYPTSRGKLNNWHAKDFTPISLMEE